MIFTVFRYFLKSVYTVFPGLGFRDKSGLIAAESLLGKSFRIDDKDNQSVTLLYRTWYRAVKNAAVRPEKQPHSLYFEKNVVIDATKTAKSSREYYIHHFTGQKNLHFIYREDALLFKSRAQKTIMLLYAGLYATCILPVFLIKKSRRGAISLTIIEFLEHIYFISSLKRCSAKHLYMFCIYEKDTNLLYLLLKKSGVFVSKISSDGPISLWNKNILSDEVIVSFPYQLEEIAIHNASIIAEKVSLWGPETIEQTAGLYEDEKQKSIKNPKGIGFYSTASWVRSLKKQTQRAVTNPENEIRILSWLNDYLRERQDVVLYVYLHPKEKQPEFQNVVKDHYGKYLKTNNWQFADIQKPTSTSFTDVKIGVGFYSTVLLERDYYGFPILMAPMGMDNFPLPGTTMVQKCVIDKYDFISEMNKTIY